MRAKKRGDVIDRAPKGGSSVSAADRRHARRRFNYRIPDTIEPDDVRVALAVIPKELR
jgi:hypothetical protein